MSTRPTLPEPIIVDRFFKNRRKDVVATTLSTFKGINIVDIRMHAMTKDGRNVPTPKGITVSVRRLRDLHAAVSKALAKVEELGLIDGDDESEGE